MRLLALSASAGDDALYRITVRVTVLVLAEHPGPAVSDKCVFGADLLVMISLAGANFKFRLFSFPAFAAFRVHLSSKNISSHDLLQVSASFTLDIAVASVNGQSRVADYSLFSNLRVNIATPRAPNVPGGSKYKLFGLLIALADLRNSSVETLVHSLPALYSDQRLHFLAVANDALKLAAFLRSGLGIAAVASFNELSATLHHLKRLSCLRQAASATNGNAFRHGCLNDGVLQAPHASNFSWSTAEEALVL